MMADTYISYGSECYQYVYYRFFPFVCPKSCFNLLYHSLFLHKKSTHSLASQFHDSFDCPDLSSLPEKVTSSQGQLCIIQVNWEVA